MTSKAVPMTSRWEYTLEPADEGCKLTIDGGNREGTVTNPLDDLLDSEEEAA